MEVTTRDGENHQLMFIVNHNFVPTTISLDGDYKDIVQDRILHGEIIIAPQHSLILVKSKEKKTF
ncbi:MAG: Beta-galactosidase C-terminal domain [Promethearchaeota archaeon]